MTQKKVQIKKSIYYYYFEIDKAPKIYFYILIIQQLHLSQKHLQIPFDSFSKILSISINFTKFKTYLNNLPYGQ
jgi:hypothetical protein